MAQANIPESLTVHTDRQPRILRRLGNFGARFLKPEASATSTHAADTVPGIFSGLPSGAEYRALSRKEQSKVRREFTTRHIDELQRRQDRTEAWARHRRGLTQLPADYRSGDIVVPALGRTMPILNAAEFDTTSLTDEELTLAVANQFFSRDDLAYEDTSRLSDVGHTPEQPKPGKYAFIGKLIAQLED